MRYKLDSKGLSLKISNNILLAIYDQARDAFPNETGGMLAGRYINNYTAIVEYLVKTKKSIESTTSFVRRADGVDKEWARLKEDNCEYLGEWHSHPNGSFDYSTVDYNAMINIANDENVLIKNPLLLIVSLDKDTIKNHGVYFYDSGKLEKYKQMVDFREMFKGLQDEMKASLKTDRTCIEHSGTKGDATENKWIDFLSIYLPERYKVDKAMVIDCEGNLSDQIDIVIYDALYTPFIFNHNGAKYIPAEGVYAVFEVKQDIKGYINYAGNKIESVRKLKRTSINMISSGKTIPARPLTKIIGGILTTANSYKDKKTVVNNLKRLKGFQTIDLGCFINDGGFYVDYKSLDIIKETGYEEYKNFYEGREVNNVKFFKPENSLFTFFFQLNHYLKLIGTVPAIDMKAYLHTVGEDIDDTF